ncbi:MAG: response regulator of the LytR/AlgR family [Bacteroidetes bacterium]|nr:MAG: response regulator of the LytR/AlgR family [Bacteroidota bacterium]
MKDTPQAFKCIIVDDDELMRSTIETFVRPMNNLHLVANCTSAAEAMQAMEHENIDLVFLDIEMPQMSGLEFLKTLEQNAQQVILITSHQKHAVEAFDYAVADFLVKPPSYNRFAEAVNKATKKIQESREVKKTNRQIFVKANARLVKILFSEILYIEALGDYVSIYTRNEKYTVHTSMKKLEERLPPGEFLRIHISYIIRVDSITEMQDNVVHVEKYTVPVSRAHRKVLMERLNLL